jgi:hypothetical protein
MSITTYIHLHTLSDGNAASNYVDSKRLEYTENSSRSLFPIYNIVTNHTATVVKSVWRYDTSGTDSMQYESEHYDTLIIEDSAIT